MDVVVRETGDDEDGLEAKSPLRGYHGVRICVSPKTGNWERLGCEYRTSLAQPRVGPEERESWEGEAPSGHLRVLGRSGMNQEMVEGVVRESDGVNWVDLPQVVLQGRVYILGRGGGSGGSDVYGNSGGETGAVVVPGM